MTIVVAVDRSTNEKETIQEARRLAEAFDDDLHVVHVLGEQDFYDLDRTSVEKRHETVPFAEIEDTAADIAREQLTQDDPDATAVGLVGEPAEEILQYSREHDARYIMIGSRKRTPVGKALFGSVTQSVLLNADRPVITVRIE